MVSISIVMPSYNAEKYISNAINSILNQTFKEFEFIIINDGSTDSTEDIILSFNDSRIRFIKNERNRGLIYSLNKGFSLANGKYIARMDSDDISLPDRLEKQISFMESKPNIGISGGQMELFGSYSGKTDYPLKNNDCYIRLLDQTCLSNNNFIIRSELIKKHSFTFNSDYLYAEDYKFYTDIIFYIELENLSDVLTKYRKHSNAVTSKHFSISFENRLKIRIEYIQKLLNIDLETAQEFYGEINFKRFKAMKKVKHLLLNKYPSASSIYIDEILFRRIYYIDALYESESSATILYKFPLVFFMKFNGDLFHKWLNLFKHYIKFRLYNGR